MKWLHVVWNCLSVFGRRGRRASCTRCSDSVTCADVSRNQVGARQRVIDTKQLYSIFNVKLVWLLHILVAYYYT